MHRDKRRGRNGRALQGRPGNRRSLQRRPKRHPPQARLPRRPGKRRHRGAGCGHDGTRRARLVLRRQLPPLYRGEGPQSRQKEDHPEHGAPRRLPRWRQDQPVRRRRPKHAVHGQGTNPRADTGKKPPVLHARERGLCTPRRRNRRCCEQGYQSARRTRPLLRRKRRGRSPHLRQQVPRRPQGPVRRNCRTTKVFQDEPRGNGHRDENQRRRKVRQPLLRAAPLNNRPMEARNPPARRRRQRNALQGIVHRSLRRRLGHVHRNPGRH